MFISIVANFYKSERFIPKLIKSVFQQTFTDWELICVVDASPGKDEKVIRRLVEKHGMGDKVRVIVNEQNIGLSRSKKVGIDAALGKYITFIDGDDFFAPEALARLAAPAQKYDVDFVNMDYYRYFPIVKRADLYSVRSTPIEYNRVIDRPEFIDKCFVNYFGIPFMAFAYWTKLYRAAIIKNLKFDYPSREDVFAEDKWFNFNVFKHINTAYFVDYGGYYWRWGGISSFRFSKNWTRRHGIDDIIRHDSEICDYISANELEKFRMPYYEFMLKTFVDYFLVSATAKPGSDKSVAVIAEMNALMEQTCFKCIKRLEVLKSLKISDALFRAIQACDYNQIYDTLYYEFKKGWKLRLVQKVGYTVIWPFRFF